MMTEAKKAGNKRWDAENMKTVATCIRRDLAEEFAAACKANGDSMHQVLKQAIEDYIADHR